MYQEREPVIGEVHRANTYGGQDFPARPTIPAPAVEVRRDVREVDKREIRPDAYLPYDPRGLVVVAGGWLAFYVIAAIHDFIASSY